MHDMFEQMELTLPGAPPLAYTISQDSMSVLNIVHFGCGNQSSWCSLFSSLSFSPSSTFPLRCNAVFMAPIPLQDKFKIPTAFTQMCLTHHPRATCQHLCWDATWVFKARSLELLKPHTQRSKVCFREDGMTRIVWCCVGKVLVYMGLERAIDEAGDV